MNMVDIWRYMHPCDRKFTWHQRSRKIAERLDYFFLSNSLVPVVTRSDILPSFCTDHSMIGITLKLHSYERGAGFWKMNCKLLEDLDYLNIINDTIHQSINNAETFVDIRAKWDFLKFRVKEESIRFSKL